MLALCLPRLHQRASCFAWFRQRSSNMALTTRPNPITPTDEQRIWRKKSTYFHTQSLGQKHKLFVVHRGTTSFNVGDDVARNVTAEQLHFRDEHILRPSLLIPEPADISPNEICIFEFTHFQACEVFAFICQQRLSCGFWFVVLLINAETRQLGSPYPNGAGQMSGI